MKPEQIEKVWKNNRIMHWENEDAENGIMTQKQFTAAVHELEAMQWIKVEDELDRLIKSCDEQAGEFIKRGMESSADCSEAMGFAYKHVKEFIATIKNPEPPKGE